MPQVPPPKRHPYDQWSPDARALDLVGDKWTLLIVRDLAAGPRRFVELQRVLPGISTEQLRSRLNRMVADGMLTRKRYREVPPRVDYELTPRARDLMPVLAELALWGYRWAWSQPRAGERDRHGRDPPARARPRHGERPARRDRVHDHRRPPRGRAADADRHARRTDASQVDRAAERRADARISGDTRAWVAPSAPGGSTERAADQRRPRARRAPARTARARRHAGDGGHGPAVA